MEDIIKNGKEIEINVYRVGKYGKNDNAAFLNYYDEVILGLKTVRNKERYLEKCKNDINKLSISCYYDKEDIEYYFGITLKDAYPERIFLYGITDKRHGISQKTKERKIEQTDSHVDWWLFKNSTPWESFNEV